MEFNSDRKRMSILVKDNQDGLYKLYIKGADNMILDRLSNENSKEFVEETCSFIEKASNQGYRTLLVAVRLVD